MNPLKYTEFIVSIIIDQKIFISIKLELIRMLIVK